MAGLGYCIVLYCIGSPYRTRRARVLEAPRHPMLVIGRSFYEETVEKAVTAEEAETGEEEEKDL